MGFDTRAISIACSEADNPKLEFHFLKSSLPPTAHPLCSWPSGQSEVAKNGPKWFSITQNMGFDTMLMLACSEAELLPKLEFLFLMSSWTSYSPSTQFLAFRSICGFWKWFLHNPKHGFWHQSHNYSMFRSWQPQVRISLIEVLLDLLRPIHSVLDLLVDLGLLKIVPNDSPSPRTCFLTPEPCL